MVGHGNKVDIHQPFAEPGHVLAAGEDHHIGFVVNGIVPGVFQHLGEAYLGLRILLLELAQNGKQAAAGENGIHHQIQPRAHPVAKGRCARLNVRKGFQQRFNLVEQQFSCRR